jgi:phage shock protein PspC (stress-responsive transcriptional regulator)
MFIFESKASIMQRIQQYFESQAFGVCAKLGEKLRIPTSSIRIFFIYASFLTFGSPLIVYLALAYILNIRKHLRRRYNTIWY